jgi:signal transduction histidine kinase
MLYLFLAGHRDALIERCRHKVAHRASPSWPEGMHHGIPRFIDQLIKTLRLDAAGAAQQSLDTSGPADGTPQPSEIGTTALRHGVELLQYGYTVEQVVHDYGDLCQAITDLAIEKNEPIRVDEFRTFNRCLDNAIADAVMEFSSQHDLDIEDTRKQEVNQKLQFLTHEMSNHLSSAMLALKAMKTGKVGLNGTTGDVLGRSLMGLRELLDGALAGMQVTAGSVPSDQLFPVDKFIAEIEVSASLLAEIGHCQLSILVRGTDLALLGDRDMLKSAVINLLQNAFKFTAPGTTVQLNVYADRDRIRIQVLDRCGGLPPGTGDQLFTPFTQLHEDKSGMGLGLAISRRIVQAHHGVISVHNHEGMGCAFTIDLPRHTCPAPDPVLSNPSQPQSGDWV